MDAKKEVPIEEIKKSDLLRAHPGEKVPVDGVVVDGASWVDESVVTGESLPAEKNSGSKVTGATLNTTGSFSMRTEKVGDETVLARIIHLVKEAQHSKAPIQELADRVSAFFVPCVIIVGHYLYCLGRLGARAQACPWAYQFCSGTHHCLSLRTWACNAYVDHGGHWPRGAKWHTH